MLRRDQVGALRDRLPDPDFGMGVLVARTTAPVL